MQELETNTNDVAKSPPMHVITESSGFVCWHCGHRYYRADEEGDLVCVRCARITHKAIGKEAPRLMGRTGHHILMYAGAQRYLQGHLLVLNLLRGEASPPRITVTCPFCRRDVTAQIWDYVITSGEKRWVLQCSHSHRFVISTNRAGQLNRWW